jgi:hypothetical protein
VAAPSINKQLHDILGEMMNSVKQRVHRYGHPVALAVLSALSGSVHAADASGSTDTAML